MRVRIDIAEQDIKSLDALAERTGQSRAALIRNAIRDHLSRNAGTSAAEAFGLWSDRGADGVVYQDAIRRDW